jgi:hypothetical protein
MGENTLRYQSENAAATYWRRRFLTLAIGLSALALVAWALSSALSVSSAGSPAGAGHGKAGPGSASGAGRSGVANGGSGGGRADRGGSAGQPKRTGGKQSAQPSSHHRGASPHPAPSTPAGYPGVRPAFCSRSDIVLSVVADQTDFAAQQSPSFGVEVVSTQQPDCSFNVGPSYLALVIKEGPVRLWSSADCVTGSGGLVSALKRGVPTVLPLTWDLKTSAPGCGGPVTRVPAGAYTAYAVQGSLVSAPLAFRVG